MKRGWFVELLPAAQAVESLIHDYGALVFHTIYGFTGDWQESQDLTQETFLQALRAIDAARRASGVNFHAKAWLLRIAVNTVRMQRRRRIHFSFIPFSQMREEKQEEMDTDFLSEHALPVQPTGYGTAEAGDPAEIVAERDAVRRAMALLPETLRLCLLLSVVAGFSSGEIADMLSLNEAAVRQRLARARKQFQQFYTRESGEAIIDGTRPALYGKRTSSDADRHRTEKNRVLHPKMIAPPHSAPLAGVS
jgi:RNA polymerase sigma-70 factor (ECF subfamily)